MYAKLREQGKFSGTDIEPDKSIKQ
jgi:hypothetical protein